MRRQGKQEATRSARAHQLALLIALALLAPAGPASAQTEVVPTADAPQPDPAARPDPARGSTDAAPVASGPAPAAPVSEPAPVTPEPQPTAAPEVAPAAVQRPARDQKRAEPRDRPRQRGDGSDGGDAVRVSGDRSWERAATVVRRLGGGDPGDEQVRQAALGLLALCIASAALQVLAGRLRRGALP